MSAQDIHENITGSCEASIDKAAEEIIGDDNLQENSINDQLQDNSIVSAEAVREDHHKCKEKTLPTASNEAMQGDLACEQVSSKVVDEIRESENSLLNASIPSNSNGSPEDEESESATEALLEKINYQANASKAFNENAKESSPSTIELVSPLESDTQLAQSNETNSTKRTPSNRYAQDKSSRTRQKPVEIKEQSMFNQFLNEIIDKYRSETRAFKSIDSHNKGFIEVIDLSEELSKNFGIDDEGIHHEIFSKLSKGSEKITKEVFEEFFKEISQERQRKQSQLFLDMNVVEDQLKMNSPFKNPIEREEIINIFAKSSGIELNQSNAIDHFTDESVYAPMIKKLRQQPNFNEFVRSYNAATFPKSLAASETQHQSPTSTISSKIFNSHDHHFQLGGNTGGYIISPSASKQAPISNRATSKLYSSLDFSKDRIPLTTQTKPISNQFRNTPPKQEGRFLSPQFTRDFNQSLLGIDSISLLRKKDIFLPRTESRNNKTVHQTIASKSFQRPSSLLSGSRSQINLGTSVRQTDLFFQNQQKISAPPVSFVNDQLFHAHFNAATSNQKRLTNLRLKVHIGLDNLQSIHNSRISQPNPSPVNNAPQQASAIKSIFSNYMKQAGLASTNNSFQSNYDPSAIDNRFSDILSRLQGGLSANNRGNFSIHRSRTLLNNPESKFDLISRQNRSRSNSSQRGNHNASQRGVHGQMQRVKQIQASLRCSLPSKQFKIDSSSKRVVRFDKQSNSKTRIN